MSKKEFLNTLRQTLEREIEPEIIEQHIRYYDDYISNSPDKSEKEILEELGDPRLIAKTIIDSEKMAAQRDQNAYGSYSYTNSSYEENRGYYTNWEYGYEGHRDEKHRRRVFFSGLTWYHKAIMIVIAILLLLVLLTISRVILWFLSVFAIPIILMYLLYSLFRKK